MSGSAKKEEKEQSTSVRYCKDSEVILLSYDDLVAGTDLSESIEIAYGEHGLGILAVEGVPEFVKLRQNLLPLAHKFANLPDDIKKKYEHPDSQYSFGWSHGKENLGDKPDYAKGSYYNNPIFDKPFEDEEIIKKYASFAHPNIWPTADLPELEPAFKEMGKTIVDTGLLLAKHCDRFVKKRKPAYKDNRLCDIIKTCRTVKARLLHYFPRPDLAAAAGEEKKAQQNGNASHETEIDGDVDAEQADSKKRKKNTKVKKRTAHKKSKKDIDEESYSSWCGWHNDHGSLTGLVPGMFMTLDGQCVPSPDPSAGLYIKNRKGQIIKGTIPTDCLAFQMGEAQQIHSGGALQATPHAIRGPNPDVKSADGLSRESFAVFMEPMWDELMDLPKGTKRTSAEKGSSSEFLPKAVPPLSKRWNPKMDFGEFTAETLKCYTVVGGGGLNM